MSIDMTYVPKIIEGYKYSEEDPLFGGDWFEYLCDVEMEYERNMKKLEEAWKKNNRITLYQAAKIFAENMYEMAFNHPELNFLLTKNKINAEEVNNIDIKAVLDHENIPHSKHRAACPICGGDNKSEFSFKNNLFKCFKCDAKGNVIHLVMQMNGMEFKEALKYLKNLI